MPPDRSQAYRSLCGHPSAKGTRLQRHQIFADAQVAAAVAHIVVPANEQNLNRLEAVLG
jgi:hypothetical protein